MSFLDDPIGSVIGPVAQYFGAERQQDFSRQNMEYSQGFNAAEAQKNRDWQERMSNTSWQRGTADMLAAGINPMLSYMKGGASTPSGGQASSGALPGPSYNLGEAYASSKQASTASQVAQADIKVKQAQAANIDADTKVKEGQPGVQEATIRNLDQQVHESLERIEQLRAETAKGWASASNIEQQTRNLEEEVPKIRATVNNLNALTRVAEAQIPAIAAQIGKTEQETRQLIQIIKQNLPEAQAWLTRIEIDLKKAELPGAVQQRDIQGSEITGYLSQLLKALQPLSGAIGGGVAGAITGGLFRRKPGSVIIAPNLGKP